MTARLFAFSLLALAACQPSADAQEANDAAAPADETSLDGPDSEVRPVRYGLAGPDLDACLTQGEISAANGAPVHAFPDATAAELERLPPQLIVHICEDEGEWLGVVYATEGDPYVSCETGSPVPAAAEYPGPCRSGWVAAERVEVTAG